MIHSEQNPFVPSIGVLTGIALAIASLGLFIYFMHHVSISLSSEHIVSTVYRATVASLEHRAREDQATPVAEDEIAGLEWRDVPALDTGYLQSLDVLALVFYAEKHNCVIRVDREVGDFVVKRETLLEISGAQSPDEQAIRQLNEPAILLDFRTIHQNPGFGIRLIVDVALKALSPGINDTTTALTCVDYLGALLIPSAADPDPKTGRRKDRALRVITREVTFASLIGKAFQPLIPWAANNAEVLDRMLGVVERLEQQVRGPDRVGALSNLVDEIRAATDYGVKLPDARRCIVQRSASLSARLSGAH
jgi:uncharacterized membrane protein